MSDDDADAEEEKREKRKFGTSQQEINISVSFLSRFVASTGAWSFHLPVRQVRGNDVQCTMSFISLTKTKLKCKAFMNGRKIAVQLVCVAMFSGRLKNWETKWLR